MGSLCSKPGIHSEDGAVPQANRAPRKSRKSGQTLGQAGTANEGRPSDPRAAAALAAEERLKAVRTHS